MSLYFYAAHKINFFLSNYNLNLNKLIIAFLILIFLLLCYFAYVRYVQPLIGVNSSFKDVANNGPNEIEVYFVFAEWCPYCTSSKGEWDTFSAQIKSNNIVNNYTVVCNEINCTDQDDEAVKLFIKNNKITSYPTVYIIKNKTRYDFDAQITNSNLNNFLTQVAV